MPIQFPQEVGLRDARRVILRPFALADAVSVRSFFQGLPEEAKRGAWTSLGSREVVAMWAEDLLRERAVVHVAVDGTNVVAVGRLDYREHGPLRRVGRVEWLIHPRWLGVGLGIALLTNFVQTARENGLKRLSCTLVDGGEDRARTTLRNMGFEEHRLPAYVTDPDGADRDALLMVLRL